MNILSAKTFLIVLITLMMGAGGVFAAKSVTVNGAGASFPYPLYSQWADKYHKMTGIKLNYQSIGSGGGITQIKAKTVDFGASDAPLKAKDLDQHGLIQFPMVMGGVVPVVNIKGVKAGQLKLSPEILADIFLGKIKKWNDPNIENLNKDLNLPKRSITIVHRSDGSGTTWIFTNYLDKISKAWSQKVGTGKAVSWPVGVGGKGNEGVASYVQRVNGSIGYVEFAYALQNKMAHVKLQNKAGNFVEPTIETFQAAAAGADWKNAPGFYMVLTDQPGKKSWPITGATFILLHKEQKDKFRASKMLDFFNWALEHGDKMAVNLHYVPMPDSVAKMIRDTWKSKLKSKGKMVWNK